LEGLRSRFSLQRLHQHRPLPSDADARLDEASGSAEPLTHTIELLRNALLVVREMGLVAMLFRMYSESQDSWADDSLMNSSAFNCAPKLFLPSEMEPIDAVNW
jgi:hypothetical protein